MIEIKADLNLQRINFQEAASETVRKFMEDVLDRILALALENLAKNESWVTGTLAQSGRVEMEKKLLEGELIFGAPYAPYVEFGTRAHRAPLGPSLPYEIERKKGRENIRLMGVPDPTSNPLDHWAWRKGEREIKDFERYGVHTTLGFAVWAKILERGSDPHPYLRPAIDAVKREIPRIAKRYGLEFIA